jgi:hypothetical protein
VTNARPQSTFPRDAIEVKRFQAITGLSRETFDSLRPDLRIWKFACTEFVGEREALAAIGRRAIVCSSPAKRAPEASV